jgi:hypothetical protein
MHPGLKEMRESCPQPQETFLLALEAGHYPPDINPLHFFIQPIRNEDGSLPDVRYTDREQAWWKYTVAEINRRLEALTDETAGQAVSIPVERVTGTREITADQRAITAYSGRIMEHNPTAIHIGLLQGALPQTVRMWGTAATGVRTRIHGLTVSGTRGNQCDTAKIVGGDGDGLKEHIRNASEFIIEDDVLETGAHAAAAVDLIRAIKTGTGIDPAFPALFKDKSPWKAYPALMGLLKEYMIYIATPVYKNETFSEMLQERVECDTLGGDAWNTRQKIFLRYARNYPRSRWLMGGGMDTGIEGGALIDRMQMISPALLSGSDGFQNNLRRSKIRTGGTIGGLIGLVKAPGDQGEAYLTLVDWVAAQLADIMRQRSVSASPVPFGPAEGKQIVISQS